MKWISPFIQSMHLKAKLHVMHRTLIFFSTVDSIFWVSHCESKQIIMILWVCWFHVLHVLFQKWKKKPCVFHIQPSDWSLYYIKIIVVLNIFFWRLFFCKIPIWMFLVQCYLPNTKDLQWNDFQRLTPTVNTCVNVPTFTLLNNHVTLNSSWLSWFTKNIV